MNTPVIYSPPSFLAAKLGAVEDALDELPVLTNRMEEGKPIRPVIRTLIKALEAYKPGLHSNPLQSQKSTLYQCDGRVAFTLNVLHGDQCSQTCEWHTYEQIAKYLEWAYEGLLDVYRQEEARAKARAQREANKKARK